MKKLILFISFSLLFTMYNHAATINVPADQATIQAAVNAAAAGDIIMVANGTYSESVSLTSGPAGITVQAVNAGAVTISPGAQPCFVASFHTGDITINGLVMISSLNDATSGAINITNLTGRLTVSNCTITASDSPGIHLLNSSTMETKVSILNNVFGNFGNDDIISIQAGQNNTGGNADILISGNSNTGIVQDPSIFVELEGGNSNATVVITDNNFSNWTAAGDGLTLRVGTGTTLSSNLVVHFLVDNNSFLGVDGEGIEVELDGTNTCKVFGDITNNTLSTTATPSRNGINVFMSISSNGIESTLNISDNNISNVGGNGIKLRPFSDDAIPDLWNITLNNNTISNVDIGINIDDASAINDENFIVNTEITNNTITSFTTACIRIARPTTTTEGTAVINYELSGNTGCTPILVGSPTPVTDPIPSSLDMLKIGDLVWADDGDGVKEAGELGVAGVGISFSGNGFSGSTTTDANGKYILPSLNPGTYTLTLVPTTDFPNITVKDTPGDDTTDSDFDPTTKTASVTLNSGGGDNLTIDAGLIAPCATPTFTALADLCIDAGIQTSLSGGSPSGGVYSGAGVTDNGNGTTYSFNPTTAGVGTHSISYQIGGCPSASDDVEVLSIAVRIVEVNPITNIVTIKNCGTCPINLNNWQLCSKFSYTAISSGMVVAGSLNLAPNASVSLQWNFDERGGDLGLFVPGGSFANPAAMEDFVQWNSAGNGRESVAAAKGIWTSGTFVAGAAPYTRADCSMNMQAAWEGNPIYTAAAGCNTYTTSSVSGSGWFSITDGSGNTIASVNPNGNDLGTVTIEMDDRASVGQDGKSNYYLPRYFNFESSNFDGTGSPFASSVGIRLFYKAAELADFNTANSSALAMGDIVLTHYSGTNEDCDISNNQNPTLATITDIVPSALVFNTTDFYLEFNVPHFSEIASGGGGLMLPVELLSFEGRALGHANELTWSTASEEEFSHFEIERSADGVDFKILDEVRGNGNTAEVSEYAYLDRAFLNGHNYYRLKMVDLDGSFEYSNIVLLRTSTDGNISVFPNPSKNTIKIQFQTLFEGSADFSITDMSGKTVMQGNISSENPDLDINSLAAGLYILQVNGENVNGTVKLIKE